MINKLYNRSVLHLIALHSSLFPFTRIKGIQKECGAIAYEISDLKDVRRALLTESLDMSSYEDAESRLAAYKQIDSDLAALDKKISSKTCRLVAASRLLFYLNKKASQTALCN